MHTEPRLAGILLPAPRAPHGDHPLAIQLPAIADREPPTGTRATPPLAAPNGRKPNRGTDLNRHNQDIPGL
jgi:hypothetical protein